MDKKILPYYQKLAWLKFFRFLVEQIRRQAQKNYRYFTSQNVTTTLDRLAPWDEYLVTINIEFGTEIVGKNLIELRLRERFNVNVVAIARDIQMIVSPKPTEVIMGSDTLFVYGNDEAISKLEEFCHQKIHVDEFHSIDECVLERIPLPKQHMFLGKSILELGIRSAYNCIVLAITRGNQRIKNPISSFVFEEGDEIFIFGTKQAIHSLNKKAVPS